MRSWPQRAPGALAGVLRRFPLALLGGVLLLVALSGWWHSSRYSERHLLHVGDRTIEVFSASSLLRVSFVNGTIPRLGGRTFYRQRTARGRFLLRPVTPSLRKGTGLFEVTLGYWHLAAAAGAFTIAAGIGEGMRTRRSAGREG